MSVTKRLAAILGFLFLILGYVLAGSPAGVVWAIGATIALVVFFSWRYYDTRQCLHRKELGLCLRCGYNLRGVIANRCPECGADTTK